MKNVTLKVIVDKSKWLLVRWAKEGGSDNWRNEAKWRRVKSWGRRRCRNIAILWLTCRWPLTVNFCRISVTINCIVGVKRKTTVSDHLSFFILPFLQKHICLFFCLYRRWFHYFFICLIYLVTKKQRNVSDQHSVGVIIIICLLANGTSKLVVPVASRAWPVQWWFSFLLFFIYFSFQIFIFFSSIINIMRESLWNIKYATNILDIYESKMKIICCFLLFFFFLETEAVIAETLKRLRALENERKTLRHQV